MWSGSGSDCELFFELLLLGQRGVVAVAGDEFVVRAQFGDAPGDQDGDIEIEAAAEHLVRRIYVLLGHTIRQVGESEDRLAEIILGFWTTVFGLRDSAVILELMVASRHDAELAMVMRKLWTAGFDTIGVAADHYFEALSADDNVRQLMVLTQWLLRGMAMDRHLVRDERVIEHYLALWSRMLASHMRARHGVSEPPPRPAFWDTGLSDIPL